MILTQNHIQRLLSNHEVLKLLPELLTYVEQIKAVKAKIVATGGCTSCKEKSQLKPTLTSAMQFIIGLAPDRVEALKKALGAGKGNLYTYVPQVDGKQGLKELGT